MSRFKSAKLHNIKTPKTEERKPIGNRKKSIVIFLVLPVVLTILLPFGGLPYLCGRYSPYAGAFGNFCLLYPLICIFIIYCLCRGVSRRSSSSREQSAKSRLINIAEIGIPIVFILSILISFFTSAKGMLFFDKPFMYGLQKRMETEADVEAIRDWLGKLSNEYFAGHINMRVPSDEWSESLRVLRPERVDALIDENGRRKIRLSWGAGPIMGHWGVVIGMEDMEIPPSNFSMYGE